MWTIGFIENITEDFLYITYSHVDQNIPIKRNSTSYSINDIIGIHISEENRNRITEICNYERLESINIQTIYEYQKYLIHIAYNRFDSGDFYNQLKYKNLSKVISYNLYNILDCNFDCIHDYINSISITEIIKQREVEIIEYEYDENGDYSYRCKLECTDFNDSYLNSLLLIKGSYSPTCTNNSPKQLPGESYEEAVRRVINSTRNNALIEYSKEKHLKQLYSECDIIKGMYLNEKRRIMELAQKYLGYPSQQ